MIPRTSIAHDHQPNFISSLPDELHVEVLSHLPAPSIAAYSATHRYARTVTQAYYPAEASFNDQAVTFRDALEQKIEQLTPVEGQNAEKKRALEDIKHAFVLAKKNEMHDEQELFVQHTDLDNVWRPEDAWIYTDEIKNARQDYDDQKFSPQRYVSYLAYFMKNVQEVSTLPLMNSRIVDNYKHSPNELLFDYVIKGDVFRKLEGNNMILTGNIFEYDTHEGRDIAAIKRLNTSIVYDTYYNGDRDADYAKLAKKYRNSRYKQY